MANIENFEDAMNDYVKYFELEGKVTPHRDYCNYNIVILFIFKYLYLSVKDVLIFEMDANPKEILYDTVSHLKEIKFQFKSYFNQLWC